MFIYLNLTYPNAYTYRSKFGDVLYVCDSLNYHIARLSVINQLMLLFSCSGLEADNVFNSWRASRPIFVRLENSTNGVVLRLLETECNTTC